MQLSIAEGLQKNCEIDSPEFNFRMVYWSDLLYRNPLHLDDNFNFDELYNEEPYVEAAPDALSEHPDNWRDDIIAAMRGAGGSGVDFLKEKFDMDKFADWVIGRFAKDLAFYYDPNIQSPGRKRTRIKSVKRCPETGVSGRKRQGTDGDCTFNGQYYCL